MPDHTATSIPPRAGIGLRAPHYLDILSAPPAIGWFEAHSENYFAEGGLPLYYLEQIRSRYPLSLHGVGLSLGSTDPLNTAHLRKLKSLIDRFEPGLVSEHLSWGSVSGRYFNDLLPLPYTEEALAHVASRIMQVQDFLGRQILVENVSSYLQFKQSTIPEWAFLAEISARSGCGILLDVNNIHVRATLIKSTDSICRAL
ncbi:MAG: MbnB/TglH/ChrH family RiPP precursor modification enzyme [Sulfuriferula sp.]